MHDIYSHFTDEATKPQRSDSFMLIHLGNNRPRPKPGFHTSESPSKYPLCYTKVNHKATQLGLF